MKTTALRLPGLLMLLLLGLCLRPALARTVSATATCAGRSGIIGSH
jgi:hypothetical protein